MIFKKYASVLIYNHKWPTDISVYECCCCKFCRKRSLFIKKKKFHFGNTMVVQNINVWSNNIGRLLVYVRVHLTLVLNNTHAKTY